jgi:hypothetical protein
MNDGVRKHNESTTGFDVHDIGLAAALMSLGHELVTLHSDDFCECEIFHFETTANVEKDAEAYWKHKLSVDAKKYWTACNYLLDRLFGGSRNEN